jgi:3'-5' exoribonuclease
MATAVTQKSHYIRDITPGERVRDLFLVARADLAQSRNGPYWNLVLQDCSGQVEAKIWNPLSQQFQSIDTGSIVMAEGLVETYRDKPQLKIDFLDMSPSENGHDLAMFMPAAERPAEEMMEELEDMILEYMQYKPWKKFCRKVLRDQDIRRRMLAAPGAKTVHHAYVGGLLEHTLGVAKLCMAMCDVYPELDRQTLLAGAIFHDLGKAWELTMGPAHEYTDEGKLLGHIQMGQERLEPFLRRAKDLDDGLKLHLRHLITSHHGEHDFGSPIRPKTPEGFALHFADNMDAKMNMIDKAYADMDQTGAEWSPYLRFLERDIFRAPKTPDPSREKAKKVKNQCLLPLKG